MRVAVDVMGGDRAPSEILKGCWQAAELLSDNDLVHLVGDGAMIRYALASNPVPLNKLKHYNIVATTQIIEMDDSPVESIRAKPDSSIAVMCRMASKGEADAVISAGNTGACVAAAQLRMRLLPGVARPGIAVVLPTFHGPVVVCDVGAQIIAKPKYLQQFALMASAYSHDLFDIESPRVALLSIGEEDAKGTGTVKEARKLLRDEPLINFIGNIEGKDVFKGACDVIVCDGFVGNILLKFTEGFTRLWPSVIVICFYELSFILLTVVLRKIAVPVAYATWGGVGVVRVTAVAWGWLGQRLDAAALLGIGLITLGVIVIQGFSKTTHA